MITMNPMIFFAIFFSPAFTDDEKEEQIVSVTAEAIADTVKERPTKTIFWDCAYNNWSKTEFKGHMKGQRNISIVTK